MYALNLTEDKRILSATYPKYAPADAVIVEALPEGDISDYLYADGLYVYEPLPKQEIVHVAPRNIVAGECVTVDGVFYEAIENIPNGEAVVAGQNAIVTTIEEHLMRWKELNL